MSGNTPEGHVKASVRAMLKSYGAYWHSPVQNGMGTPSLDMICCFRGRYLAVECKAPGKKLTPRQELTKKQIEDAGGTVIVVGEKVLNNELYVYSGLAELEAWLIGLLS